VFPSGRLAVELPYAERPLGVTPWRIAMIGDLRAIVGSDLPIALGRPSEIPDPSWIRPGRVAWSWWSDSASPSDLKRQEAYVDAAAANGWEYVLVDDKWATGTWMPELTAYAARRGVGIHVWTPWTELADPTVRAATLDQWAAWGIAGVKIDFLHSDRAARMTFVEDAARAAAERRLLVNFHGSTIPRGLQRTWPNVLSAEAVRGSEITKSGAALDPAHDVNVVFTRNVVGSMDYTPVAFSAPDQVVSAGHELAKAIAYESGLQHYADAPDSYAARPAALALLRAVPAAWDDTLLLEGRPDRFATIARRAGDDGYVGSLWAGAARTATLALDFLPPGRQYALRLIADDGAGGVHATDHVVRAGERVTVPVAANGGYAAQLRAI
jgi:alpha-glucosidase